MGEVTVLEPTTGSLPSWWDAGAHLLSERRAIDWKLADWLNDGAQAFGAQACFDFAAEKLSVEPKQLREQARVALAFPPALRAPDVPFEVHGCLSTLPPENRLETLQRASSEHWTLKRAKSAVTVVRQQTAMFDDEDMETRLAVEIMRAWNRAPIESRRYFWELAKVAVKGGFGIIDEDETV
jgi:hypothetical protein